MLLQIVNNEIPSMTFMLNAIFYFVQWYFDMKLGEYTAWFYLLEAGVLIIFLLDLVWICSIRYKEIYGES